MVLIRTKNSDKFTRLSAQLMKTLAGMFTVLYTSEVVDIDASKEDVMATLQLGKNLAQKLEETEQEYNHRALLQTFAETEKCNQSLSVYCAIARQLGAKWPTPEQTTFTRSHMKSHGAFTIPIDAFVADHLTQKARYPGTRDLSRFDFGYHFERNAFLPSVRLVDLQVYALMRPDERFRQFIWATKVDPWTLKGVQATSIHTDMWEMVCPDFVEYVLKKVIRYGSGYEKYRKQYWIALMMCVNTNVVGQYLMTVPEHCATICTKMCVPKSKLDKVHTIMPGKLDRSQRIQMKLNNLMQTDPRFNLKHEELQGNEWYDGLQKHTKELTALATSYVDTQIRDELRKERAAAGHGANHNWVQ
jgi:hypothetical protein